MPTLQKTFIEPAPEGALGFDVNHPLTAAQARSARRAGFRFCIRYVPRLELAVNPIGDGDITEHEADAILDAGLSLVLVQHVSNPGWTASAAKGMRFGRNAAIYAAACGFPVIHGEEPRVSLFLDLEEVNLSSGSEAIVAFCNEWYEAVWDSGFEPGIYVGSKNGLNAQQLFQDTPFRQYWHAASEADPPRPRPNDRGYQLFQPLRLRQEQLDQLEGVEMVNAKAGNCFECDLLFADGQRIHDVDVDFARPDARGGRLNLLSRAGRSS